MTLYFANPCSEDVRAAMVKGKLGFIDTPAQGNKRPEGLKIWCADNGRFGKGWPGHDAWLRWLERQSVDAETCAFATAPDVVGDAAATMRESLPYLQRVRDLGYSVAFVGQNGLEQLEVPWDDFDAFFIGGDTDWKLGEAARNLAEAAKARGKWVHMGRVNSRKRYRYARSIGCDSVDGTYLTFGPSVNLPKLMRWLDEQP